MNDQIVFSLTQLLAFGSFLIVLMGAIIGTIIKLLNLGKSVKKIKDNDLGGFVKLKDFQEFQIQYTKDITELKKDVKYLKDEVCKK